MLVTRTEGTCSRVGILFAPRLGTYQDPLAGRRVFAELTKHGGSILAVRKKPQTRRQDMNRLSVLSRIRIPPIPVRPDTQTRPRVLRLHRLCRSGGAKWHPESPATHAPGSPACRSDRRR